MKSRHVASCRMQNALIPFCCFIKRILICWHWNERSSGGNVLLSCHRTEHKTNKKGTSMTSTWGTCKCWNATSCPTCIAHSTLLLSTVRSPSVVLLSFTMSHQCFREAWLFLGFFISCSTKETCLHALRVPETPRTHDNMWWVLQTYPQPRSSTKGDSRLWRRSTARPDGSNNGALFQICCLSRRMPFKLINAAVVPLKLNFNPHLTQPDV